MSDVDLFLALDKAIKSCNNKKIISAANKDHFSDDLDAVKCKAVAQLRADHIEDALATIQSSSHKSTLCYEHAYALFRNQQFEDALGVLERVEELTFPLRELKAQVYYRLEQYDEAISLYNGLLSEKPCMERETNLLACYAAANLENHEQHVPPSVLKKSVTAYEHTYNRACLALARREYSTACALISQSQEQCVKILKEDDPDITEEELSQELALLKVQEAVILHKQGDENAAKKIYLDIIRFHQDIVTALAVASNNIVAINRDRDVFSSKHRMRTARSDTVTKKLSRLQREIVDFNECLLMLHSNTIEKCRKRCQDLRFLYPNSSAPSLIEAFSYLKERKVKNKAEHLEALFKHRPDDYMLGLVLAHEYASHGNFSSAMDALLCVGNLSYKPAYIGFVLALSKRLNQMNIAEAHLEQAISYWQINSAAAVSRSLQHISGNLKLQCSNYDSAAQVFQKLVENDPEDLRALASLIIALAHINIVEAEQVAASISLPQVGDDTLDLDELEEARKLRAMKANSRTIPITVVGKPEETATQHVQRKKRAARKRPGKRPKNMIPGENPDPNRWLPKKKKSVRKNRHGGSGVLRGTQGSADVSAEILSQLDASNRKTVKSKQSRGVSADAISSRAKSKKKGGRRR